MKTCPACGKGRVILSTGWGAHKFGTYSLPGMQVKVSAQQCYICACSEDDCDWAVAGTISGTLYDPVRRELIGGTFTVDPTLEPLPTPYVALEHPTSEEGAP